MLLPDDPIKFVSPISHFGRRNEKITLCHNRAVI